MPRAASARQVMTQGGANLNDWPLIPAPASVARQGTVLLTGVHSAGAAFLRSVESVNSYQGKR